MSALGAKFRRYGRRARCFRQPEGVSRTGSGTFDEISPGAPDSHTTRQDPFHIGRYLTAIENPVLFKPTPSLPDQISKPAKTSVKYQLLANA